MKKDDSFVQQIMLIHIFQSQRNQLMLVKYCMVGYVFVR